MRRVLALVLLCLFAPAAAAQEPSIEAPGAIVVEASTGDVAWEKAADTQRPMASTTKLMTALLALENGGLDALVTAPRYDALPVESLMGLVAGERISVEDLLRGLLLESGNDAAVALARHVAGSVPSFVRRMNRRAQQLGLTNTSYANPIGLDDPRNYSTPRDLATLTLALRKNRFFRRTVDSPELTTTTGASKRDLGNRNTLLAVEPWVDGVKTGNTSLAGDVLVASGRRRDVPVVSVVMGAASEDARNEQSLLLLDYGIRQYKAEFAVEKDQRSGAPITIRDRAGALLPVAYGRTVRRVIGKGEEFSFNVDVPDEVEGPIQSGDRIGEAVISLRGKPVARVPMIAAIDVPKAGFARRAQNALTQPLILVALGVVLLLATLLTQRNRGGWGRARRRPASEETTA